MRLAVPPVHYVVHLNRHTPTGHLDKSPVQFDDELDLSFTALTDGNPSPGKVGQSGAKGWRYRLYAVCFHQGRTAHEGHYFASVPPLWPRPGLSARARTEPSVLVYGRYVRHPDRSRDVWLLMNDDVRAPLPLPFLG